MPAEPVLVEDVDEVPVDAPELPAVLVPLVPEVPDVDVDVDVVVPLEAVMPAPTALEY